MGQWWVLMWGTAVSHLTLSLFLRIFGQEQRPAVQEPKRGETEFKWTIFFPRVDVQVKRTLRVCVCRSCVCQRTRSWRSALTGKSWVTRSVLIRWDTSVSICASLLAFWGFLTSAVFFLICIPAYFLTAKQTVMCFPSPVLSGQSDGDSLWLPTHWGIPWHLYVLHARSLTQDLSQAGGLRVPVLHTGPSVQCQLD